jgi:SAM-dependent methyltransferase
VQGDIYTPPFNTQFDLIGLFDVLEHLPNDRQVLRDIHAMLKTGGALLLTVPAHPLLWSYFDEACYYCRRYELSELQSKLICTGYRVEYITQYMASIFPLVWLGRGLAAVFKRRLIGDADCTRDLVGSELRIIPLINELLGWLLTQESRVIAWGYRLPIGTSLIAVARKNSTADVF